MTPAKMFDGDLYVLAADAVQMAENAYQNGQTDEREACAQLCDDLPAPTYVSRDDIPVWDVATLDCGDAIRARSQHGNG